MAVRGDHTSSTKASCTQPRVECLHLGESPNALRSKPTATKNFRRIASGKCDDSLSQHLVDLRVVIAELR